MPPTAVTSGSEAGHATAGPDSCPPVPMGWPPPVSLAAATTVTWAAAAAISPERAAISSPAGLPPCRYRAASAGASASGIASLREITSGRTWTAVQARAVVRFSPAHVPPATVALVKAGVPGVWTYTSRAPGAIACAISTSAVPSSIACHCHESDLVAGGAPCQSITVRRGAGSR